MIKQLEITSLKYQYTIYTLNTGMHRGAPTMELKTKKEKTQVIVPVRLQKTEGSKNR